MSGDDPFRLGGALRLRRGRDAAVRRGHPWIYRGALATPLPPGMAPVKIESANGENLGVALPGGSGGSLALRIVARAGESWSAATLHRKLRAAVELRAEFAVDADAYRLVHAEGDRLPGLVVDRYGEWAVIQPFESAWEPYLDQIAGFLAEELGFTGVVVRRGAAAARPLLGDLPAAPVVIREGAARFPVDVVSGQKTGFYLDQRDNRSRFATLARGLSVLNLFSYSGGFAVAALVAGARSAVNVDASTEALALARRAYELNGLPAEDGAFVAGDAFRVTRDLVAGGVRFQAVVVDPPAFVKRRSDLYRGLQGYRDINLQALTLLETGGLLVTCSCSALVGEEQVAGALLAAALDAGRDVAVLERRFAGPDHPALLACPETRHLKVLICRVGGPR